ncbi:MAG: hypothetical protein ACRENH_18565, partial [Gemmatimonadaceae bacterium]
MSGDGMFRYHRLFSDFLLRRAGVSPERRRTLHARAAQYYAQAGDREEAVQHLLAADDHEGAAHILTEIAPAMAEGGRHQVLGSMLEHLPNEVLGAHPALLYARGETLRLAGRYADALPAFEQAIARFRAKGDAAGEVRAIRGQALVYLDTVQPARADTLLRGALRKVRGDSAERQAFYTLLAENTLNSGNLRRAERMYRAVHRMGGPPPPARLFVRLGRFADVRALSEAERLAARVKPLSRAPRSHREPSALLAWTEAMIGEAELARQHAEESLEVGHALGSPTVESIALARLGLAWLSGRDMDPARARQLSEDAIRLASRIGIERFEVEPLLALTIIAGIEGRALDAEAHASRALRIARDGGDTWVGALLHLAAGAALALAEKPDAATWLRRAVQIATSCGDRYVACAASLWLAIHASRFGSAEAAREHFAVALQAAQREGYGFLFQGSALLAPHNPALWSGLLRRAQKQDAYARELIRQLESGADGDTSALTVEHRATAALYVQTLGAFRVWRRGQEIDRAAWGREKAVQLLQLLVCHRGHALHREQVLEALWPDATASAAATGLRVAVSA